MRQPDLSQHSVILKNCLNRKRRVYAWVLLITLFLQRILGMVGSDIVYAIEIDTEMTEVEKVITEKIHEQTGANLQIQVQGQEKITSLLKMGYATPFVLSEEIDGKIHHYSVVDTPSRTVEVVVDALPNQPDSPCPLNPVRTLKHNMIADFYFWESAFRIAISPCFNYQSGTSPNFWQAPSLSIPTPPPQSI